MNDKQDAEPKLKVGDVVRLKSGGPWMTVVRAPDPMGRVEERNTVETNWFTPDGALRGNVFRVEQLERQRDVDVSGTIEGGIKAGIDAARGIYRGLADAALERFPAGPSDPSTWGAEARTWAVQFHKMAGAIGYTSIAADDISDPVGWLIGWFANAIEAGATRERERGEAILGATDEAGASFTIRKGHEVPCRGPNDEVYIVSYDGMTLNVREEKATPVPGDQQVEISDALANSPAAAGPDVHAAWMELREKTSPTYAHTVFRLIAAMIARDRRKA